MARNLAIKHIRTTKANLDSQASASGLNQGEIYLITDEDRIAIGLSATTYETFAKESEAGGGSSLDINALTAKTTPVDADITVIEDSASSWAQKKLSWSNIKATLKTYFDTLYVALTGNQTVAGVKTFSSFPVTPSSAPTTDYQVANKKYVDDNAGGGSSPDYTVGTIDFGTPAADATSSSMVQITTINTPTFMRITPGGTSFEINGVYINTSASYSGAFELLQIYITGSLASGDSVVIPLIPNMYYGFTVSLGFAGGNVYLYDLSGLSLIDTIPFTVSGGGP